MLALSQPLSVHSILSLSLSVSLDLSCSRVFYLPCSFRRALFAGLWQPPDSPTSLFRFFYVLPTLSSLPAALFLSGEFLIIESRRDRERLALARGGCLRSSSSAFSRHAIVPNLRPTTPRSFYRTVDFDGFIRTLYSQSLYSRDLKSLIIGATSAVDQLGERIMKRETRWR